MISSSKIRSTPELAMESNKSLDFLKQVSKEIQLLPKDQFLHEDHSHQGTHIFFNGYCFLYLKFGHKVDYCISRSNKCSYQNSVCSHIRFRNYFYNGITLNVSSGTILNTKLVIVDIIY